MKKKFRVVGIVVGYAVFEVVFALAGLYFGAMIGSSFNDFMYQGLQGYAGAGLLGMHITIGVGLILIIAHALRTFRKKL